jgi:hypothetical protein
MDQLPDIPSGATLGPAENVGEVPFPQVISQALPAWRDVVMRWSLILLWLFNLMDLALTRVALRTGAQESNAVVGYFMRWGLGPTLAFKIGVVTLGSLLLWRYRHHPPAIVAGTGLALAYALVVVYHFAAGMA